MKVENRKGVDGHFPGSQTPAWERLLPKLRFGPAWGEGAKRSFARAVPKQEFGNQGPSLSSILCLFSSLCPLCLCGSILCACLKFNCSLADPSGERRIGCALACPRSEGSAMKHDRSSEA